MTRTAGACLLLLQRCVCSHVHLQSVLTLTPAGKDLGGQHACREGQHGWLCCTIAFGADTLYHKCSAILDRESGEVHVSLFSREGSRFPALGPAPIVTCVNITR